MYAFKNATLVINFSSCSLLCFLCCLSVSIHCSSKFNSEDWENYNSTCILCRNGTITDYIFTYI